MSDVKEGGHIPPVKKPDSDCAVRPAASAFFPHGTFILNLQALISVVSTTEMPAVTWLSLLSPFKTHLMIRAPSSLVLWAAYCSLVRNCFGNIFPNCLGSVRNLSSIRKSCFDGKW